MGRAEWGVDATKLPLKHKAGEDGIAAKAHRRAARSDSLLWRGAGVTQIPSLPDDCAPTIRGTIGRVVAQCRHAER